MNLIKNQKRFTLFDFDFVLNPIEISFLNKNKNKKETKISFEVLFEKQQFEKLQQLDKKETKKLNKQKEQQIENNLDEQVDIENILTSLDKEKKEKPNIFLMRRADVLLSVLNHLVDLTLEVLDITQEDTYDLMCNYHKEWYELFLSEFKKNFYSTFNLELIFLDEKEILKKLKH